MRNALVLIFVLAQAALAAPEQPWAEKMFNDGKEGKEGLTHDFGIVPHGAQLFHRFTITNIYAVPMEITELVPGCGCVKATPSRRVLQPRETATIDVSMDARRFTGNKNVVIRVTVGPQFTSVAELMVSATSRADIVFNPGQVSFGQVTRGQTQTQSVDVEYAGSLPWEVTQVVVAKELPVDVVAKQTYRRPGQVGYRLTVTLKTEAPVGLIKDYIYLKTNDPNAGMVPLLLEANIQPTLTVAPGVLSLGSVKTGEPQIRRVVVRGNKPFRILEVEGQGEGIALGTPVNAGSLSVQTVTFRCLFDKPGDFKRELKIKTDLPEGSTTVVIEGSVAAP